MKKFTREFKIMFTWFCIATVFFGFLIILNYTGQLVDEETGEATNGIMGIIIATCMFVLPPLITMIVLLAKHKAYFIIDDTKDVNYYKKFNNLSSEANCINIYYEKFFQNEQIKQICANYCSQNTIHLRLLEFLILPVTSYSYELYRLNVGDIYGADTDYLKQLKLYDNNILKKYLGYLKSEKDFLDNWDNPEALNRIFSNRKDTIKELQDIFNLFHLFENQGLIVIDKNDRKEAFKAICFLIYRNTYMNLIENAKTNLDNLDLNETNSSKEIMEKMYDFDIAPYIISNTLFSLESKKSDYFNLVSVNYDKYEEMVRSFINDKMEKRKLENLMNTNKNVSPSVSIDDIDMMSGAEFEQFITYMFNQMGYKASNTKLSGDQGIDVIAEKGNSKIAIQTKCYSQPVGNHAIMEAVAGAKYYNANKCMVITNSTFTKSARELAQANNVVLWDRQILKEKLEQL